MPGRIRAKKKDIERIVPAPRTAATTKIGLRLPQEAETVVEVLGTGPEAAPKVVDLLRRLGLIA